VTESRDFGVWLRAEIDARGMTQRQLGKSAGLHHSTISRLLRGERGPTFATVLQLEAALDRGVPLLAQVAQSAMHPASLCAMLRNDGYLTDDQIAEVVALYARLVAARASSAASRPARGRALAAETARR
jgi:transcriptional regulator with XRE-family HTH domain